MFAPCAYNSTQFALFSRYLSPLMLDKGVVTVTAFPGAQGDTARLECTPASSYYTLANTTKTRTPLPDVSAYPAIGWRTAMNWRYRVMWMGGVPVR